MSGYGEMARQIAAGVVERENALWEVFVRHSEAYVRALEIDDDQVSVLRRAQPRTSIYPDSAELAEKGFLQISLDGQEFVLVVKHVCGVVYNDEWRDCIIAFCVSTPDFNESVGGGTTFISVLPEDWHSKLATHLATGDPWQM